MKTEEKAIEVPRVEITPASRIGSSAG